MEPKYYVKIAEGLGNQMFEYAWARTMQKLYGGTIVIDPHAFGRKHYRSLSMQHFVLNDNVIFNDTAKEKVLTYLMGAYKKLIDFIYKGNTIEIYRNKAQFGIYEQISNSFYDSWLPPRMPMNYFEGNWMAEYWFKPACEELKRELKVKDDIKEKNKPILEKIKNCNSVCIHIRLGDFLREPYNTMSRVCGNEYYNEAIRIVKEKVENPVFFLFSNRPKDFEYIKSNFKFAADIIYVNMGNTDYEDLRLMYNCKHQIMSNSTYSWWAQYLNENPHKVVVAPAMLNKHNKWDLKCLFCDYWTLVAPEYLNLDGITATAETNSLSPKIEWSRVEAIIKGHKL